MRPHRLAAGHWRSLRFIAMTGRQLRVGLDGHVVGRRQTGNERYLVGLADALATLPDVDLRVFVDSNAKWPGEAAVETRYLRWRSRFLRLALELPMRAWSEGLDLLHVQYVRPPICRVPVVTSIHDISFEDLPDAFTWRTRRRMQITVRHAARTSAGVVTISEFTKRRLVDRYGLDPARVHVTPLGVDPGWHRMRDDDARQLVGPLGLGAPFVLAIGNVHPRKNLPRLVRAVAKARAGGAGDLKLALAGQRAWRSTEVDRAIEEVHGHKWVHWTGYVSDEGLRALYSLATVVAYPSLYEGFGLPVLEAMACGAVVVAGSLTAIPEVAGDAAILVDPRSTDDIAAGILRAISNDAFRDLMSVAAVRRARTFTWNRCARQTVEAYRAILRSA